MNARVPWYVAAFVAVTAVLNATGYQTAAFFTVGVAGGVVLYALDQKIAFGRARKRREEMVR